MLSLRARIPTYSVKELLQGAGVKIRGRGEVPPSPPLWRPRRPAPPRP